MRKTKTGNAKLEIEKDKRKTPPFHETNPKG
jgi:hypothetical protein